MRLKHHAWNFSKVWKQGDKRWVPALCGTGVAKEEKYAQASLKGTITCERCRKALSLD